MSVDLKSHPLRVSGKCPTCDQVFFINAPSVPESFTLECANARCGELLLVRNGRVFVFHEALHASSEGAWPKDGTGTAFIDLDEKR
jgi:hypothetical protein